MLEYARDLLIASCQTNFLAIVAWQSTVWLGLGLIAGRVLRRQAAKAHCVLVLATAAAVATPLLTLSVRQMDWGALPAPQSDRLNSLLSPATAIATGAAHSEESSPAQVPAVMPERMESRPASARRVPPIARPVDIRPLPVAGMWVERARAFLPDAIVGCWMLVSLALALRLVHSIRLGQRTAGAAHDETCPELVAALRAAAEVLGLKRSPHVCVSRSTRCAMIWCWGSQPLLLLPESAAETCGVNWRSVFCHELAHLARRDHWSALWAEVLVIALPWQPLAWRSRRRLAFLREQACDDWVLAAGGEAVDYAESLLQLVPQGAPVYALAAVTNAEALKQRLKHVLAGLHIASKVGRRWFATAAVVSLAAAAGVALAQQRTAVTPEKTGETTAAAAGSEAASAGATRLLPAREEQGDVFTVRGRVLKSDGQPAAGARVSIVRYYFDAQSKRPPVAKGQAGPQGEFELSYRKSQIVEAVARPEQWKETSVVAEATGFGLEWAEWGEIEPSKPFTLRLVRDVPIHGRVVDLQGRPVAGVRLIVGGIDAPKSGTLDAWLDAVKKGATPWVAWPLLGRNLPPLDEGSVPPVTTDHDGRFTLTGIGAERVANLELRGDTVAYKNLTVATRAMSPLTQEHLESDTDRSQVFGKDFTFEAFPSQPIVGTVRDAATGQPLAGVGIESWLFAGTKIGGIRVLRAETDQKGSYRLVGMPRGTGNKVLVLPNDDQPYFMRELTVPPAPGSGSATLDIELHRGLWIIGRVTDRVTGDPVLAYLHYLPFRSNSDASRRPEFDANGNVDGDQHRYRTRADGSFRIPGMPGRAIVGAEAILASYRRGYGAQQIKGKDKNGYFATWRNPISATTKWPDALVEINPPKTAQAVACDLTLDPGESVRMHVVDPVGKPVSGCQIQGRRPSAWDLDAPSTFEVVSLVPGDMRTIVIRNDKRSLGKFVVLKFDEKTPRTMTVQLEPTATFAGRLLDEDGAPLKGITLEAQPLPGGDFWPRLSPIVCQPDGTFEYKEIPSGCRYSLLARGQSFGFATAVKEIAVEPGKTARLGDIKLKRRQ